MAEDSSGASGVTCDPKGAPVEPRSKTRVFNDEPVALVPPPALGRDQIPRSTSRILVKSNPACDSTGSLWDGKSDVDLPGRLGLKACSLSRSVGLTTQTGNLAAI